VDKFDQLVDGRIDHSLSDEIKHSGAPASHFDDEARDLTTALIGYTIMTLSTGVPVDGEDLHRFVRRQFAIYSVRGHAGPA
jgi:hypothetical protein